MARIAIFAPHPDDGEIGMGGTIALLASQGHDILLCDVTDGCPTPIGDRPTRLREADEALRVLRDASRGTITRVLLDLPNRRVEHSIATRHAVAGVIRAHQAEIIFCPHPEDAHPDHLAVTRIVEDARFDAKLTKIDMPTPPGMREVGPPIHPRRLFYYYCSHLRAVPDPSFIVDVSAFTEAKIASIRAYRTQFELNERNAAALEWFRASLVYFGSRIGAGAGEPFFAKEPLGLRGLESVV